MSSHERRNSPRKECVVPVRFRVVKNGHSRIDTSARPADAARGATLQGPVSLLEGEAVNLSERGVFFVCREKLTTGEEVEMFFTIPSELTGRSAESVRCKARIMHAGPVAGNREMTGAGVFVDHFQPLARSRDWAN